MQLFMEPRSALSAAPLKAHLVRPYAQPYWCLPVNAHYTLPSFPGNIKGRLNVKVVIITSYFLDFEHLISATMSSLKNGLYTLRASPAVGYGGLYATGNGVNEDVTVAPHSPPFVERQVVSTRHLHVFWMTKTINVFLFILFSGTFKLSLARIHTLSLSTPLEVPLEDIGPRRTENLFLKAPSLLRKSFTNGTLRLRILQAFPTPSRTYTT